MANLILTNYCNANCEFCFAAESLSRERKKSGLEMSEGEFCDCMEFLRKAGINELRLLGGEPTLHPRFKDFAAMGRKAGMSLMVFTNGLMPESARDALAQLEPEICTVVVNMNAAVRPEDISVRAETLRILGKRVTPGITLTSPDFSLLPLVMMIERYGLNRSIRIGLSNPTWKGSNRSLHPKRYPAVGQALYEQSFLSAKYGITLEPDCGFVRCMFGNFFDGLVSNGFRYVSHCSPVADLCAGGDIIPCFALSNYMQIRRDAFEDASAAYAVLEEKLRPLRSFGIYPECSDCPYFNTETCSGGCTAARLRRIQPMTEENI